ncbi:divergent polysaccharide deacetylase family protein [Roseovarius sp. M141]|nr:divergent polysaccharide deacetylase family protein [Roseovarius sp. M141]
MVAGTVVSGLALGAMSVAIGPEVSGRGPDAGALDVPAGSGFNQARDDTAARLPRTDGAPALTGGAPQFGVASPDDLSQVAAADTAPTMRPEISAPQTDLTAPEVMDEGSGMPMAAQDAAGAGGDDAYDASDAASTAPAAGGADASISADPAQPSLPEVEGSASFNAAVPAPQLAPVPQQAETADDAVPDMPSDAKIPDNSNTSSGTVGGIETQRLPIPGASPKPEPAADDGASPTDRPAIRAYASGFDNPEGRPLMSVVLIDDGTSAIGLDALASFPYPLSFAVDAAWPGATDAMRRYRDAGFEVLAIADLPANATVRDTETNIQMVESAVPEAVAILEGTGEGLQISGEASERLASILMESGRGLVIYSKGLETAPKLIAREGMPVATVFRDVDSGGQSATVVRRFLDQAASKSRRDEGGVILVGRLQADTIRALLLWGVQDRASLVALAPVSAVLTENN